MLWWFLVDWLLKGATSGGLHGPIGQDKLQMDKKHTEIMKSVEIYNKSWIIVCKKLTFTEYNLLNKHTVQCSVQCTVHILYTSEMWWLIGLEMWWLSGSAPGGRGPGFKSGISHNDPWALQDRWIINTVKSHGRGRNLNLRPKKYTKIAYLKWIWQYIACDS